MCGMIIDNGSYTNIASINLVKKLGLTIVSHPKHIVYGGLTKIGRFG
jgi:hypothetical protein